MEVPKPNLNAGSFWTCRPPQGHFWAAPLRPPDQPSRKACTFGVTLDGEAAAALSLIIQVEAYGASASEAKMAKLARAATEAGRDHRALRRVAQGIVDALDPRTAGPP
jgi:hypothetical protein